jgi:TorA maturation chaperone TorD
MTNQERSLFCQCLASLFSPPEAEVILKVHQGAVYAFLKNYIEAWKEDITLFIGFHPEGAFQTFLEVLKSEYDRHFSGSAGGGISLVESYYKPWTQDPTCSLSFASSTGYLMGDAAVHLSEVYRQCHIEVPEEFKAYPDHLVLEIEFLSFLYQWAMDGEIRKFIRDHLDWIPSLKEEFIKHQIHSFYLSVLEVLDLFLKKERERLEVKEWKEEHSLRN